MEELAATGVVGFSDDGAAVASPRMARALMTYLAPLGLPLIEHAEDPQLAAGALMRGGPTATRLGLAGWPASAELTVVERDIALAAETGARLHLTHLSTAASLEAVRRAKAARPAGHLRRDAAPPGHDRCLGRGRPHLRLGRGDARAG